MKEPLATATLVGSLICALVAVFAIARFLIEALVGVAS